MESRNVTLTLDKAKEFYNSGNTALREVALQAYTIDELTTLNFTDIKDFWDAVRALGLDICSVQNDLNRLAAQNNLNKLSITYSFEGNTTSHLQAIYKLDIIRKALNKGWNPKMTEGNVYYPYVRFYPAGNEAEKAARKYGWEIKETFNTDGQKYALVCGDCNFYYLNGLGNFSCRYGDVRPNIGLLSCKSEEIAKHMSLYFAKEIFEATYAQYVGTYEWI